MAATDFLGTAAPVWLLPVIAGFLVVFLIFFIAVYIYCALALMALAKRLKIEPAWLAWIPIANVYLITKMAGVPWWTLFAIFLGFIPFIGGLVVLAAMIWWFWKISEKRGKEGWWGILMIIPIVNLVILGILAWGKD